MTEDLEELPGHKVKNNKFITNKKQLKLKAKLIKFCQKHFEDYKAEVNVY